VKNKQAISNKEQQTKHNKQLSSTVSMFLRDGFSLQIDSTAYKRRETPTQIQNNETNVACVSHFKQTEIASASR
jgi:hypothetical protein